MIDARYFVPSLCFVIGVGVWMGVHLHRFNRLRIEGYYMIVHRFPILSMMFGFAQLLNTTVVLMYRASTWDGNIADDCGWGFTLDSMIISYAAPCIVLRLYLLIFTYRMQQEFATHHRTSFSERTDKTIDSSWSEADLRGIRLMNHQVFRRPTFVTFQLILITLSVSLLPVIGSATCHKNITKLSTFLVIPVASYILILTFMMRKTEEVMGIKAELKITLVLILMRAILKNIGPKLPTLTLGPFYFFELLAVVMVIILFVMAIVYPQRLVRRQIEKMEKKMEEMDMVTFLTETKYGSARFSRYLQLEFCVENLLFWRDTQEFQKRPSVAKALRMYQLYIMDFARLQVNIPFVLKTEVERGVKRICMEHPRYREKFNALMKTPAGRYMKSIHTPSRKAPTPSNTERTEVTLVDELAEEDDSSRIFEPAQQCVERLLTEGPWIRFLCTNDFQSWKKQEVELGVMTEV